MTFADYGGTPLQEMASEGPDVAIERFNGLVILATNLRDDIDTPFTSAAKLRWRAVRFPRPKTH